MAGRKQFWQSFKKNSAKSKTTLPTKWWIDKKKLNHSKSNQYVVWTDRNNFENPTEGILHVTQKRWRNFFGETFFRRKIVLDIQNLSLTTLPRKVCQWGEIFLLKVLEGQSELSFWNYFTFPQNGQSIWLVAVLAIQPVVLR